MATNGDTAKRLGSDFFYKLAGTIFVIGVSGTILTAIFGGHGDWGRFAGISMILALIALTIAIVLMIWES